MIKIRRNVFETNSSSVHSIVVCNEALEDNHAPFVFFQLGEFGWSMDVLDDTWERASYFYTAACALYGHDVRNEIINLLEPLGIDCTFNDVNPPVYTTYENYRFLDNGGIDHVDECKEFVDTLMNDGEMLARFLLDDRSFVVTGNDNCDYIDRMWMEKKEAKADDYAHTTFYKGN
ncbi:MAG: hypothetical protein J6T10_02460 [Methanobrevibacter sp.]|nr:hypothetical protein [Methanobrevibacter sp.]